MKEIELFLFLDIDGVLNGHQAFANGYCGMKEYNVRYLNTILERFPNLKVVLSSAWRYSVHNGDMTLAGLVYLFQTHGVDMRGRFHGITESDEETMKRYEIELYNEKGDNNGELIRRAQIRKYVADHNIKFFIVLDDLDLQMPELIRTHGALGLDGHLTDKVIERFEKYEKQEKQTHFRGVLAEKSQTVGEKLS